MKRLADDANSATSEPTPVATPDASRPASGARFRPEAGHWLMALGGEPLRLRDSNGVRYLYCLMRQPGTKMLASDLVTAGEALGPTRRRGDGTSDSEQSRINVTKAINATLRKIAGEHAALGAYLNATIRTGMFCLFDPSAVAAVDWDLGS